MTKKICIFKTSRTSYGRWEEEDISRSIPIGDYKEVTDEEYCKYNEYILWYNNKNRYQDTYLTLVELIPEPNWEDFDKEMKVEMDKQQEAKRKREVAAAKRKATKEKRAKETKEKKLKELAKELGVTIEDKEEK